MPVYANIRYKQTIYSALLFMNGCLSGSWCYWLHAFVEMDAISMITSMAIGFSVDYAADIAYGYVSSKKRHPSERIQETLAALGWPLTQGAVSTILAVIFLADIPAYMIVTFFKTVFLAISLGLLHGLVFLPVALSIFVRGQP